MKIKINLLIMVGVVIIGNSYADTFSSYIYNNSGGDWRISFFPNIKGSNVNIHGCQEADVVQNGPCTIGAGTKIVNIQYINVDSSQRGNIDLLNINKSEDLAPICLSYDNNNIDVVPTIIFGNWPHICWIDNTVNFNNPSNGDITLNSI